MSIVDQRPRTLNEHMDLTDSIVKKRPSELLLDITTGTQPGSLFAHLLFESVFHPFRPFTL